MTKTSRFVAICALMAAAFSVSACKFGETKPKADPVAAAVSGEPAPAAPEASSAPVTAEAPASTAPASDAAASSAKPGKQG